MAIVKIPSLDSAGQQKSDEISLTFNNGDCIALKEIVERLGFKDEESAIRFALAVLSKSATRSLTITDQNGTKVSLNPSEGLLKPTITTEQK